MFICNSCPNNIQNVFLHVCITFFHLLKFGLEPLHKSEKKICHVQQKHLLGHLFTSSFHCCFPPVIFWSAQIQIEACNETMYLNSCNELVPRQYIILSLYMHMHVKVLCKSCKKSAYCFKFCSQHFTLNNEVHCLLLAHAEYYFVSI